MKLRAIHLYVVSVCLAGVAVQPFLDWHAFTQLGNEHLFGLAALTALGVMSESLALTIKFGGSTGNTSITFIPLSASVLAFGPPSAVVFVFSTGVLAEFVIRKKEPLRATFNIGQYLLSTALAGWVFVKTGGLPQAVAFAATGAFHFQIIPFVLFALTFMVTNHTLVAVAVGISQRLSIRTVLSRMAGGSGTNILYDLLVSPIAVVVVFLYVELGVPGLGLVLLPLFFIRHSYLTNYRLQRANRDLLRALVKAIETRDPYTSGHSMRVASLSKRIAERLGLPEKHVESVETAALLHDIGKIDAEFTGILRKAGGLTEEERTVIQSHVTQGVALLTNFASYSTEILDAVRYHHERMDGSGYPEGLSGDAIPIAARIINTCDAIDAMLSDRPYRRALSIERVHSELLAGKGTQFDTRIVEVVVNSDLLPQHKAKVESTSEDPPVGFVVEAMARESTPWFMLPRSRRRARDSQAAARFPA
jgi:putative nucleotidyltransferase with HDIG domain